MSERPSSDQRKMASQQLQPTLTGTVEYRLKLGDGGTKRKKQKKGTNDAEKKDGVTVMAGKKRPRPTDDGSNKNGDSNTDWVYNAGYFFVPRHTTDNDDDANARTRSRGYPIVYPFTAIDTLCRAAVTGQEVQISRYHWVNFGSPDDSADDCMMDEDESQDVPSDNYTAPEYSARVLEVHRGGMHIIKERSNVVRKVSRQADHQQNETPMTLTAFAKLEIERRSTGKTSQGSSSAERYSIVAKIDATSAIIAAIPSDPFALIELYEEPPCGNDDDNDASSFRAPLSAVAVLRGRSALAVHEALQPGATLTLKRVRRQRWHVPRSFEDGKLGAAVSARLKNRAPTHVFVVDDGRSISWSSLQGDKESLSNGDLEGDNIGHFPHLPSTPVPLYAIQGEVVSVRRANIGSGGETIHSIVIDSGDGTGLKPSSRYKLYMTYYPMTPGLIWGLKSGALIRAVNVYPVNSVAWTCDEDTCRALAASVRSTVAILDTLSDAEESMDPSDAFLTQAPVGTRLSATRCNPYSFMSLKRSCDEMEWRERLRTEWYNKSGLGSLSDAPQFEDITRNLLAQYEESTRSAETKLNGNEVDRSSPKKKSKRDPYVEFFNQACDEDVSEDAQPTAKSWPTVLPLKRIRDVCIGHIKASIDRACVDEAADSSSVEVHANWRERNPIKSGWTASKCFNERILRQLLMDKRPDDHIPEHIPSTLYACGIAGERLSSLRDGSCRLPVCLALSEDDPSRLKARLQTSCGMNVESGTFLALPIHSVVVSCICLGAKPKDSSPGEAIKYLPVPTALDDTQVTSGCAVFVVKNLIFIASAHIRWVGPQVVRNADAGNKLLVSVQDSLDGSITENDSDTTRSNIFVVGRLARLRFSLRKLQHGTYKGCVLTSSHVPLTEFDQEDKDSDTSAFACDMQSIELKISAKDIPNEVTRQMRQALRYLLQDVEQIEPGRHTAIVSHVVCDDQIGLATAWWTLADDARFSPLLSGGRDESQTSEGLLSSTHIRFPLVARETSGHGYRRFNCSVGDVAAFAVHSMKLDVRNHASSRFCPGSGDFDCVGGEKFLPGTLDRLPERQYPMVGDRRLFLPENVSGIPTHTLAQLHWNICKDLNSSRRTSTAPSLARRVAGARLLGVSFCRARAECTRCFQFLCRGGGKGETSKEKARSGVVTSVRVSSKTRTTTTKTAQNDCEENTFWHLPLDFDDCDGPSPKPKGGRPTSATKHSSHASTVNKTFRTNLRCPNECPIEFAAIKWECSGVIDDGTGQAKLHAEREAALALIGSGLDVKSVEDGAWTVEGGISFQKSVPPRSFIRNAVREAQMMAHQLARDNSKPKTKKVQASDVLRLLTPEAKAEYTLQRYCRFSKNPMRCVDIICRCKPISDDAKDLNRTDVEVTTARCEERQEAIASDAITYTLPPLKLNLIDLCTVESTKRDVGWSLVRALGGNT